MSYLLYDLCFILACEEWFTYVEFCEYTAQTPHIYLYSERQTKHHLRRTIPTAAKQYAMSRIWLANFKIKNTDFHLTGFYEADQLPKIRNKTFCYQNDLRPDLTQMWEHELCVFS